MDDDQILDLTPIVTRKLMWDLIDHNDIGPELYESLNLCPSTEEGEELEHTESHKRLQAVVPIARLVEVYSMLSAEIMAGMLMDFSKNKIESVSDDIDYETLRDLYIQDTFKYVRAGSIGILSQLMDIGIIKLSDDYLNASLI